MLWEWTGSPSSISSGEEGEEGEEEREEKEEEGEENTEGKKRVEREDGGGRCVCVCVGGGYFAH